MFQDNRTMVMVVLPTKAPSMYPIAALKFYRPALTTPLNTPCPMLNSPAYPLHVLCVLAYHDALPYALSPTQDLRRSGLGPRKIPRSPTIK